MTLVEVPTEEPRPTRGRPAVLVKVLAVVVGALLVAALVGWQWLGHHPELAQGSASATPDAPLRIANDGVSDTRYVLDGDTDRGELRISLRNDGRVPFTVLGLEPLEPYAFTLWSGLKLKTSPESGVWDWDGAKAEPATVDPGGELAMVLGVKRSRCNDQTAGGYSDTDVVRLQVRQLGITTIQEFRLPLPVVVKATKFLPALPGPDCPADEDLGVLP